MWSETDKMNKIAPRKLWRHLRRLSVEIAAGLVAVFLLAGTGSAV